MTVAFSNYSLLTINSYSGAETIPVAPSTTVTTNPFELTMWDSVYGVYLTIVGTRYGVLPADVTVQIQQATMRDAPDSAWENVGAAINFGAGGVIGAPTSVYTQVSATPGAGKTFMNYFRIQFTAQAVSGATITKLFRSSRGR